jgi:hypothetical protein
MATLTEIRTRVRLRLEEASAAVWSDAELDEVITATLEQYSERFPREATATPAINGTNVAIPNGARSVLRVALENGAIVPKRAAPVERTADERLAWETFAGVIWFTRPLPAQTLTVWYLTSHAVGDVPDADAGLLVLGAVWRALEQRGVQELKRSGPAAGGSFGSAVQRAREEFERAFDQRARRVRAVLAAGE